MIIGFEAKRLFQNCSGLGNYSRNTINLLDRYYPDNQYKLFAPKKTDLFPLPDSATIITPQTVLTRYFSSYWRLNGISKLLVNNKIELFHGLSHLLPYGIEKTGIPSVVTIHDLIFLRYPEYYKKIDQKMYTSVYKSSCSRASKILAISNQTKNDLIHFFEIDPSKIEVIYQSCARHFYERVSEEQKSKIRQHYHLPEDFILCVGTIENRKNQLSILQAVVNRKIDLPIVLLGRAKEYIKDLQEFIVKTGIENQVIFLHNTNQKELQAIYQMATLMVYPSFFEGFGLPVLEAQASGCPVVTSNISSMPEAGGEGACYVDPTDVDEIGENISKILSDSYLRSELIKKGTINSLRFSEEVVAKQLMNLYTGIVNTGH